jgi:hypothetical protein
MKKILLLIIGVAMLPASIKTAAHTESSTSTANELPIESSSIESHSLNEPGRPLTPAEYERFKDISNKIAASGVDNVNIDMLIDFVTDGYLKNIVANELLDHIRTTLIIQARIERLRTRLNDFFTFSPAEEIILDDKKIMQLPEKELVELLATVETYHGMPPIETNLAEQRSQLTNPQQLKLLIDAAAEGTLQNHISPFQFLELVHIIKHNGFEISEEQRALINLIIMAIIHRNIKENPTYNMFRNDAQQNRLLQSSEIKLKEYYAETGRQLPSVKSGKKSFAQRWFTRRK